MDNKRRKDDLDFLYNGGYREGYDDKRFGRPNRAQAAPENIQDSAWARGYRAGWNGERP